MTPTRARLVAHVVAGIGFCWGAALARGAVRTESASNDCLIAVQDRSFVPLPSGLSPCTDGDPDCDGDLAADGVCTIRIRGCLNVRGVTACEPRPIRRFSFRPNRIVVAPVDAGATTSVCGAFIDLPVPLRKNGRKPGRRKVVAKATADTRVNGRNADRDVIVFECRPGSCGAEPCATTTTTTSTTRPSTTGMVSTMPPTTTTTLPAATCGNDVIEPGETCDGTALGDPAPTCLHGGTMRCRSDCASLDDSGCFACANGRREGPEIGGSEECDGNDIGTAVCADGPLGPYHGGKPGCSSTCQLDFGGEHCWRCGDGELQLGEECDAGAGNGTPQVNCDASCQRRCGDGIVQQGEQCDDGGRVDGDGCASVCFFEWSATWAGGTEGDTCEANEPECVDECYAAWGIAGIADPMPTTNCVDGAACDADGAADGECVVHYFYCLNTVPFSGPVPCDIRRIQRVALVTPPTDLDATARDAFLDSFEGVLGRLDGVTVRDDDGVTRTTGLGYGDVCGDARVTIPAGESRVLAVAITDSGDPADSGMNPRTDHDELVLGCIPAS